MLITRSLAVPVAVASALLIVCACTSSDAPTAQTTVAADVNVVCFDVRFFKTPSDMQPFAAELDSRAQQAAADDPRWKALAADIDDLRRAYLSYQSQLSNYFAKVVSDCAGIATP